MASACRLDVWRLAAALPDHFASDRGRAPRSLGLPSPWTYAAPQKQESVQTTYVALMKLDVQNATDNTDCI